METVYVLDLKTVVQEIDLRNRCYNGLITVEQYLKRAVLPASRTDPLVTDIFSNAIFGDIAYEQTAGRKALCTTWKQWLGRQLRELRLGKSFNITHHVGHSERFDMPVVFFKVTGLRTINGRQFEHPVYVLADGRVCFQTFERVHSNDMTKLRNELAEYHQLHNTGGDSPGFSADMFSMEEITWVS